MIKEFNLGKMLETMNKGQIMRELESIIDTAIAAKIEQEARDKEYQAAKARVANDTYTLHDIELLLEILLERDQEAANIFEFLDSQLTQDRIANSNKISNKGPRPTVDLDKIEGISKKMPIFESEKGALEMPVDWALLNEPHVPSEFPMPKGLTFPPTKTDLSFEEVQAIMKALGVN